MIPRKGFTLVAAIVLGAALAVPSAIAKCPKECKQDFGADARDCLQTCKAFKKKEKRDCKKACKTEKKRRKMKCKIKTASPTFPSCSPSGAFIDASLE